MTDKCLTYDPSLFEVRMKAKKFSTTLNKSVIKAINLSNFGFETITKVSFQKAQRFSSSMTGSKGSNIRNNLSRIVKKAMHKERPADPKETNDIIFLGEIEKENGKRLRKENEKVKGKQSKGLYNYLFNTSELPSIQKVQQAKKCKKYGKNKFINILDLQGKRMTICKNLVKSQKLNYKLKLKLNTLNNLNTLKTINNLNNLNILNTPQSLNLDKKTIGETSRNLAQKKMINRIDYHNNSTTHLTTSKYDNLNLYKIIKQLYNIQVKKSVKIKLPRISLLDNTINNHNQIINYKNQKEKEKFRKNNHKESLSVDLTKNKKIETNFLEKNSNERMIRINVNMDYKFKHQSIYLARLKTLIERMN